MNVYFTAYRCNCTILEKQKEDIPDKCKLHNKEIIYGLSGAHELIQVDEWQPLGIFDINE